MADRNACPRRTHYLTEREIAVWRFVHDYQRQTGGVSPSFMVIAHGTDISSKSGVFRALDGLERAGIVRRLRDRARAIEVLQPPPCSSLSDGTPLYFVPVPQQVMLRSDNLRTPSIALSSDDIVGFYDYMEAARVARAFRGENYPFRDARSLAQIDHEACGQ